MYLVYDHYIRVISGLQIIVNLAEQHGREGVITDAYRKYVEEVTLPDVEYVSCELYHRCALTLREILPIRLSRRDQGDEVRRTFHIFRVETSMCTDMRISRNLSPSLSGHLSPRGERRVYHLH
jgi:hypothetical protein